jgi:hypothetical protein
VPKPAPARGNQAARLVIPERSRTLNPAPMAGSTVPAPVLPSAKPPTPASAAADDPMSYGQPPTTIAQSAGPGSASASSAVATVMCPACHRTNEATRKLCEACGARLDGSDVTGSGKKGKKFTPAGTRKKRRKFRFGRVLMSMLFIAVVILGFLPGPRHWVTDKFDSAKTRITQKVTLATPDPTKTHATSAVDGHDGVNVSDENTATSWLPKPDDKAPMLTLGFAEPTNLSFVFIHTGVRDHPGDFGTNPRPKTLALRLVPTTGGVVDKTIQLADDDKPQKITLDLKNVAEVQVRVSSCYPELTVVACGLAELEFEATS